MTATARAAVSVRLTSLGWEGNGTSGIYRIPGSACRSPACTAGAVGPSVVGGQRLRVRVRVRAPVCWRASAKSGESSGLV